MRMRLPPLLLAALVVALSLVRGDVSANGLCALYSFVPFTNK